MVKDQCLPERSRGVIGELCSSLKEVSTPLDQTKIIDCFSEQNSQLKTNKFKIKLLLQNANNPGHRYH